MTIPCPHCAGALSTDGKQPGQRLHCARCHGWVLLCRWPGGSWYGVKVNGPGVYRQVTKED